MTKKLKSMVEKEILKELKDLKLSREVEEEAKSIVIGERGLMPVVSNEIEIVWVNQSGYGRKAILSVDNEGKKEFEKVMEICKKNYKTKRIEGGLK